MRAAVKDDWHWVEEWIGTELDCKVEVIGKRLTKTEVHFVATNQKLADKVQLMSAMDGIDSQGRRRTLPKYAIDWLSWKLQNDQKTSN